MPAGEKCRHGSSGGLVNDRQVGVVVAPNTEVVSPFDQRLGSRVKRNPRSSPNALAEFLGALAKQRLH